MDLPGTVDLLRQAVPGASIEILDSIDLPAISVDRDHLIDVCRVLRDHDQLQYALGEFAQQHELTLLAPPEIIAATQTAMRNARRWLADYQAPHVTAAIDFFAAAQSLCGAPHLIEQWNGLTRAGVRSEVFATDHNELMRRPELHASLVAALARAGCP